MTLDVVSKEQQWQTQSGKCFFCGEEMLPVGGDKNNPRYPTWEHIIPKAAGGGTTPTNIKLTCLECNNLRSQWNTGQMRKERLDFARRMTKLGSRLEAKTLEIKSLEEENRRLAKVILEYLESPWWERWFGLGKPTQPLVSLNLSFQGGASAPPFSFCSLPMQQG